MSERLIVMAIVTDAQDVGWRAQSLRLTMFLSAPLDLTVAATLWKAAMGVDPEIDENRPREGIRRQGGPWEDCYLETTITSARLDWVLAPKIDPQAPVPLYYGSLDKAMRDFTAAGQKWLAGGSPSIYRLAVGAVLLMPVESTKAAYEKLAEMLEAVQVDADHSLDFFYQINWPRASAAVTPLRLNRLTRWTALAVRAVNVLVEDNKTSVQTSSPDGENFCWLECDHSTAAQHAGSFTPTEVEHLFQELCQMVKENAERGEVKGTELI
jgi:hypothetical protein